jgi:hypothetical protein
MNINFINILYGARIAQSVERLGTGWSLTPCRIENFHFSTSFRLVLGSTQPPIQWVPGAISPGVKRQGREADHSLPASAEVKKIWTYTSTLPHAFMA